VRIRRVSSRGGIQVARQRIQVGMTHAGKIVTVIPGNNTFRVVIDGEAVGGLAGLNVVRPRAARAGQDAVSRRGSLQPDRGKWHVWPPGCFCR